jgi:hypothetical protein
MKDDRPSGNQPPKLAARTASQVVSKKYHPPRLDTPRAKKTFRDESFDRAYDLIKRIESAVIVHSGNPKSLHARIVAALGDEITSVRKHMEFAQETWR